MSDATLSRAFLAEETRRYHHFITLALWLSVITGAEIVLIFLPVPMAVVLSILILLSVGKFFAVILWFMHLIYDKRLLFWVFLSALLLALGTFAALLALMSPDRVDTKWFS
jgi:cytochrome c oxidase subunit 4